MSTWTGNLPYCSLTKFSGKSCLCLNAVSWCSVTISAIINLAGKGEEVYLIHSWNNLELTSFLRRLQSESESSSSQRLHFSPSPSPSVPNPSPYRSSYGFYCKSSSLAFCAYRIFSVGSAIINSGDLGNAVWIAPSRYLPTLLRSSPLRTVHAKAVFGGFDPITFRLRRTATCLGLNIGSPNSSSNST